MRTVLVGAVDSTRAALETLAAADAPPAAIFTLPLEKAHRHSDFADLRPVAARYEVPVESVADVNAADALLRLRQYDPDIAFVIGWSQICRQQFLATPRHGCIGYHPSALPENRGRAVIPWTILQGVAETGSTLFWLDQGLDSGDILLQHKFPVSADETARTLYDKHLEVLRRLLRAAVELLANGSAPRTPQDHRRATYCAKRVPADGLIDWDAPAVAVARLVRAVGDPYPGAFTFCRGRRLYIRTAAYVGQGPYVGLAGQVQVADDRGALVTCGDGELVRLTTVQWSDADRAPAAHVLRRHEKLGIDWVGVYERLARAEQEAWR